MTQAKISVGLVGAGPWAALVHAPILAHHERTRLAGVWARRPEAAAELASAHGAPAFDSFEALLDHCDAVCFSVPPDVQAELGIVAARAGKALFLEKPIALDLAAAERLAAAVDAAGVPTQLNLTWRYTDAVRGFLEKVHAAEPIGGRGHFVSGALLGSPFATPWRIKHGALLDVGPHIIDLLDAALGPVVGVRCHGDASRWFGLLLEHESGVMSEASLSAHSNVPPFRAGVEVYTHEGVIEVDCATAVSGAGMLRAVSELADVVATRKPHALDVHRGLHLQKLLDAAVRSL